MTAFTLWLTGIPGSGKTTLAAILASELRARGLACEILDGEELRRETPDLGFTLEDRMRNMKRAVARAQPMLASGTTCVAAFVSPHRALRSFVRRKLEALGPFVEVWLRCDPEAARERKPELYARVGGADFYQPGDPELVVDAGREGGEGAAAQVLRALEARGLLPLRSSPLPMANPSGELLAATGFERVRW